jgi:hypothetical protein
VIDFYIGDVMTQSTTLTGVLPTIAMWLVYGMAGMFLVLAAICALGAIIYPFYILFEGIRRKLL